MPANTLQMLAIDQELRNAMKLIRSGLGQLQAIQNGSSDFLHLPLLTLASGFERYVKVTLCFEVLASTSSFPKKDCFPTGRKGHDLTNLLEMLSEQCFRESYLRSIPVAMIDKQFIKSKELGRFIKVLGDFGQTDRYYFLDVVVSQTKPTTNDPERAWRALELVIATEDPTLLKALLDIDTIEGVGASITAKVVAVLERLARAIARLYTIGNLGTEAKRHSVHLLDFVTLRDEDLGANAYSLLGIQR